MLLLPPFLYWQDWRVCRHPTPRWPEMEVRILVVLIVMATDNELVEAIAMPFHVLYPITDYFFRMSFKRGRIVNVEGDRNMHGFHFE